MGRIIVEQIVSADGFAAETDGGIGFFAAAAELTTPEVEDEQLRMLETVDAIVLGRTTYAMFEAYWPDVSPQVERVAAPINALPKYVVSSTLSQAPWGRGGDHAHVLRGDAVASVCALRGRGAGDLIVWGSLTLTDALLRAGAVDLLRLRVVPVLIGAGRPFVPADLGQRGLVLDSLHRFASGAQLVAWRFA